MKTKKKFFIKSMEVSNLLKRVYDFFKMERDNGVVSVSKPILRLSKATGLNMQVLQAHIHKAENQLVDEFVEELRSDKKVVPNPVKPVTCKTGPRRRQTKFNEASEELLMQTVLRMQKNKEFITLRRVRENLIDAGFKASINSITKVILKLGYRYYKAGPEDKLSTGKGENIKKRHIYLRKIQQYRQKGHEIVYVGQTWLRGENYLKQGSWSDLAGTSVACSEASDKKKDGGSATSGNSRIIILDAGSSRQGLIPGCALVFTSRDGQEDYYELNAETFTKWFRETLLPKLNPASIIVLDCAPFHCQRVPTTRVPNSGSSKCNIQSWLSENRVKYDEAMPKPELLELVKKHKTKPRFLIDDIAKKSGHTVLRLPPYHSDLNPFEKIWINVKDIIDKNNCRFKFDRIKDLYLETRVTIGVKKWREAETHVVKNVENKLRGIDEEQVELIDDDETSGSDSEEEQIETDTETSDTPNGSECDDMDGIEEDTEPEATCNICKQREPPNPPKTIKWFQCENCSEWIHQKCAPRTAKTNKCIHCEDTCQLAVT